MLGDDQSASTRNVKKSTAENGVKEFDTTGKLVFPLLKGYDDYDRVLKEILGEQETNLVLSMIDMTKTESELVPKKRSIFRTMKTLTARDLDKAMKEIEQETKKKEEQNIKIFNEDEDEKKNDVVIDKAKL